MEITGAQGSVGAIILAGGKGSRMQSDIQKQYMEVLGKPLFRYSLEVFQDSDVQEIVLVTGAGEEEYVKSQLVAAGGFSKVAAVVAGGKERYHSVYEGLKALKDCDYVLVHDGARALVTAAIIARAIAGAKQYEACVVGMPVKDTIKVSGADGYSVATPDRTQLWQVQTPQAFSYPLLRGAYGWIMEDETRQEGITDDAMVVEHATGKKIRLIEGSYENLKVTTPEDLVIVEALLQCRLKTGKK